MATTVMMMRTVGKIVTHNQKIMMMISSPIANTMVLTQQVMVDAL